MEINDVNMRSSMAQQMTYQLQQVQAANPAYKAGTCNPPLKPTALSYAVLGEFGVLEPEETFNIYGTDKVNKLNKSKELSRLGSVKSQYYNPFLHLYGNAGKKTLNVKNPSLSFMRGELGQNMPLFEDAIYKDGGRVAAKLNLVC